MNFLEKEKVKAFDEIAERFYKRNFGQMSKADTELLMFHIYMKNLMTKSRNKDGNVDFNKCSDYIISKELGITQQRVRNLKVKEQLVYGEEIDWKEELKSLLQNARYDEATKKVIISIPDPNLYLEIQNYLEEQGGFIEKQLNSKLLQMRIEYFLQLAIAEEPEENRKKIERRIKKELAGNNAKEDIEKGQGIGKVLISHSADIAKVAGLILPIVSPSNTIFQTLAGLLSIASGLSD